MATRFIRSHTGPAENHIWELLITLFNMGFLSLSHNSSNTIHMQQIVNFIYLADMISPSLNLLEALCF